MYREIFLCLYVLELTNFGVNLSKCGEEFQVKKQKVEINFNVSTFAYEKESKKERKKWRKTSP